MTLIDGRGLAVIAALGVCDVLWGVMSFAMYYRRERRGRGMSPMPPLLFMGYWWPCFLSEEGPLSGIAGHGFLRLLDSLLTLAVLMGASIFVAGVGPYLLACKLAKKRGEPRT